MGIAEFYPPVVDRLKGSFEVAVKMAFGFGYLFRKFRIIHVAQQSILN